MTTEIKTPFEKLDEGFKQDLANKLIKIHVNACQSYLVSGLFEKEVISIDDYTNLCYSDDQIKDIFDVETDEEVQEIRDNGEDIQEVFEHWLVSDWLLERLEELGHPILKTNFESWWGRCTTGQAICLDYDIQKLAYDTLYDERLYQKKEVA